MADPTTALSQRGAPMAVASENARVEAKNTRKRRIAAAGAFLLLLAVGSVVILDDILSGPANRVTGAGPAAATQYRFITSADTPEDRILLKTSAGIKLTHQAAKPDKVTLAPEGGDKQGSFTWTIIPHQGSSGVKRLLGETEFGGTVYKTCEAINDSASPQPEYAERYFSINNSGARYTVPQRIDAAPFLNLLRLTMAKVPEGKAGIGKPLPADVMALAEKLIPLCTGQ